MVDLLDTAGQEEFGAMRDHYLRSGEGFLVVYSITERATFTVACELYESIMRLKETDHVPIVLVGNKCDLEEKRAVSTMEASQLARTWDVPFFETSAKNRYNIEAAFNAAVASVRKDLDASGGTSDKKDKTKAKCVIL
jgi:small GTP-binding protein